MPLISVDATQVNERDGSILNLGQKSLVAIELRNWITREFEAPLQPSEIMTDQCIHSLARKVAPRSRIALSGSSAEGTSDSEETDDSIRKLSVTGILTPPKSVNSSVKHVLPRLPPLPLPALEDILKMFGNPDAPLILFTSILRPQKHCERYSMHRDLTVSTNSRGWT